MLNFLITAGPTVEDLDPVRFISNRASGRLGVETALAAWKAGHRVTLVHGPLADSVQRVLAQKVRGARKKNFHEIAVRSAAQMHAAVQATLKKSRAAPTVVLMTAAVADFTPVQVSASKLKKAQTGLVLRLKPTVDILKELGRQKQRLKNVRLIGFALETGHGRTAVAREKARYQEARRKLERKNLDALVLDSPAAMGSNAAQRSHFAILRPDGSAPKVMMLSKPEFARELVRLSEELAEI